MMTPIGSTQGPQANPSSTSNANDTSLTAPTVPALRAGPRERIPHSFPAFWPRANQLKHWLSALSSPAQVKLPVNLQPPANHFGLPADLLQRITQAMSTWDVGNWARVCRYHYEMVNTIHPSARLPTFLRLLPNAKSQPSAEMVESLLDWLNPAPDQPAADLALPLHPRLRCSLTLALLIAIPSDGIHQTKADKLARDAVSALGQDVVPALSDLLDRFQWQRRTRGITFDVTLQHRALNQLACVAHIWNSCDNEQLWRLIGRSIPPLRASAQEKILPPGKQWQIDDLAAMVHLVILDELKVTRWPDMELSDKMESARACLSDYLGYARELIGLLDGINKPPNPNQGYALKQKSNVTAAIVRMPEVLALTPASMQELLPQTLALLEAEAEILARDVLASWFANQFKDVQHYLFRAEIAKTTACMYLVPSMLWRFAELTDLALAQSLTQPEFLLRLQRIADKWPDSQNGFIVRAWLKEKVAS